MFPKALLLALVGAITAVTAAPAFSDLGLMQFALTLEHLESSFFSGGLSKYSTRDFTRAGYPAWVRGRFQQIADNEATHVAYLQQELGSNAPAKCTYDFPYHDVKSFINLAQKIESISAGTYLGLARHINDTGILNAGASIAATEARQAGWITSTVLKDQPWDGAFETPIPPSAAWSLIRNYISSCPDSNPDLPLVNLPSLKVSDTTPTPGETVTLTVSLDKSKNKKTSSLYAAWLDGLNYIYTDINNDKTTVPHGLSGTVFLGIVSSKDHPDRDNFVTGFTVVQFPFDSSARHEV